MPSDVRFPAVFTIHWPTGPTPCCVKHANALVRLGLMLGTRVAATRAPDGAECMNCINEAKTDAAAAAAATNCQPGEEPRVD